MKGLKIISGPCSAESEGQVLKTALAIKDLDIDFFRAGLWKPRTRPGCFEGVGFEGIPWMQRVKKESGLKICTEVARREHVEACLEAGFDMLWIGARTTVNPFQVQELAEALKGSDVAVYVKNPVSRDLELWAGAVERLRNQGIENIGLIHRGFPNFGKSVYRNATEWQVAVKMRMLFPGLPVICDPSHIAGDSKFVPGIAQEAMDLGLDGLMVECHISPESALSDRSQQLTPCQLRELLSSLNIRSKDTEDGSFRKKIAELRSCIDNCDAEILEVLSRRMEASREIGRIKKMKNISILQMARWDEVMAQAIDAGSAKGLSKEFITDIFNDIHKESLSIQNE